MKTSIKHRNLGLCGLLLLSFTAHSLELEPRQWSHLPTGANFGGLAYAYTEADIGFDPVLELRNVQMEANTWAAKYIRTFEALGKSARVDITQGYKDARWKGLLRGEPAATERRGLADTFVRFAISLYGSPPLKGREFAAYRAANESGTIIGAGLAVRLPTGDYQKDKLLNISDNRFAFRPQLGVSHSLENWVIEATTEVSFYTENEQFFGDNTLEQDPLFFAHTHLIYNFRPGLWISASAGYEFGGETKINGEKKDDEKENIGWGLKAAYPINPVMGLNLGYINIRTRESTGADSETLMISFSYMW